MSEEEDRYWFEDSLEMLVDEDLEEIYWNTVEDEELHGEPNDE